MQESNGNIGEFAIPVDKTIEKFRLHLQTHHRTILSARYGDGKSYFLQRFMENEDVQEQFVFLRLFPVNYQVVENKDIFDLIKYDLIFQLFISGMIEPKEPIEDKILLPWFIMTNGEKVASWVSKICGMIGVDYPEFNTAVLAMDALSTIVNWKKEYEAFKKNTEPDGEISVFLKKMDSFYLYETDAATTFIKETIAAFKEKHEGKKVVLMIEDMDRLDPAHLFRILNVLSAQVDYAYRYGISSNSETVAGNKFGVDNVLLVMDYGNTQSIYQYLYGKDADFKGYIHKFISHKYFTYSFEQEKYDYFINYMVDETQIQEAIIREIVPMISFEGKNVRAATTAIRETKRQIVRTPRYTDINTDVALNVGLLQLFVVERLLGEEDKDIIAHVEQAIIKYPRDMVAYFGGYWLVFREQFPTEYLNVPTNRKNYSMRIGIVAVNNDGTVRITSPSDTYYEEKEEDNIKEFVQYMLDEYVAI
ncbi:MAG: hypothetical protein IJQ84_04795 [Paludibacteraceae bacterium]|nr:hypothetical protein [Paludibacteraceae bacterium]